MTFDEILLQVLELLQREGRVSYRALKRRFALDDDYVEDLKAELIDAKHLAVDEDGKVLVWMGNASVISSQLSVVSSPQPPAPQTLNSELRTSQPPAGERRQLTLMFIDLVGSTALSAQLDPEDYHARVVAYQAACRQVIAHYDGHIAQYLGDGVLVYFGYPAAHDEDAVRAVRSGLEIVEAVSQLEFTPPLQVRLGIHTGLVVIGEIGGSEKREMLALGETPNLAARLQGVAKPDTVMISATTQQLVHGLFTCSDLGPQDLKGITTPITAYQVLGKGAAQNRFDVAVQAGLTPLVGREEELALLRRRWQQATAGEGQVILLSGEPGIGKSRLVQELKGHVAHDSAVRIEFRCSPYHQNSALYPIIDHLQRLLRFEREDLPEDKLRKLEHVLASRGEVTSPLQTETLVLFASLLSLPHPEGYPPITVSPQKQKERTHEALVAWLIAETKQHTVYTIWEDLHWADPSTLEVLNLVVDQAPTTKLYMLLTFRPEFTPPWGNRSHLSQLTLSRLGRGHVEAMVERVTGSTALPHEIVQQIVSKTDGVPLFVEELTKSVVEATRGQVTGDREQAGETVGAQHAVPTFKLGIPATLQDALMARLDRLGAAKEIAQLGATIGREFFYELLHAVSLVSEETLQHGLKQLVEAELVYQRGLIPQAHYVFKHALIQDTAYQSLLKSTRQQYHQQIAQKLEEQFPETKETQPELLAHHYTEAGLLEQAIPYWQQAGQRAIERSANVEAISHLTTGLDLLGTLPDTSERIQQELRLQITLGGPLIATKGYGALEVERACTRALELCRHLGETPQLFSVLHGLVSVRLVRAEYKTAHELAEQCLSLAQSMHGPTRLMWGHNILGQTLFYLGEFAPAQDHMEQAIALYDPQKDNPLVSGVGQDPKVTCLCFAARVLWLLGYPNQALKRIHEALTLAQELSHPFSLAYALHPAARLHQFRREGKETQEQAEALIALSSEQGFPFWLALGTILRGWALAEQGQGEEGIAQMRQGLVAYRATGAEYMRTHFLALLAEGYEKVGQAEEGLSSLSEALMLVNKTGERSYEAELYRLKGQLTLQKFQVSSSKFQVQNPQSAFHNPQLEAEACFLKAIEIARKQQAKSLELRAVMSLVRLRQHQAQNHEPRNTQHEVRIRLDEAHKMLSGVYYWFIEGFDTKDLQEAKILLEELEK